MPTQRDVSRFSITNLAWIARCAKETASKRLRAAQLTPVAQDGKTIYYDPRDALPILFGVGVGLDPRAEKARLDAATADLRELELAAKRGELVAAGDSDEALIALATTASARMQSLPSKLAAVLAAESNPATCEQVIAREVAEALSDLADAGSEAARRVAVREEPDRARGSARARGDATAAEADGAGVGRAASRRSARKQPRSGSVEE